MNIGIFISRLAKAGPVNVIYNLIHETNDSSIKYTVFTFRPEILNNTRIKDFEKLNIPVYCVYKKNPIIMWFKIIKELSLHNINIIHAHCFRTLFLGSLLKIKKIFTLHQNFYHDWILNYGLIGRLMVLFENKMIQHWDIIITCAKHLEIILRKRIKKDNIYTITNGIVPSIILNKKTNKKGIVYVYVGSIDKRKNTRLLCEQFSQFSSENEKLICIGTGADLALVKSINYSNVELLGFKDNITDILFQSDYFISMSTSEGLPLAVIEALSCKLPVILSDIPAHRDFFSLNENIGVLITDGLENALKRIRKGNYEEMSKAAYKIYSEHLTAKQMADEYIKRYKCLYEK